MFRRFDLHINTTMNTERVDELDSSEDEKDEKKTEETQDPMSEVDELEELPRMIQISVLNAESMALSANGIVKPDIEWIRRRMKIMEFFHRDEWWLTIATYMKSQNNETMYLLCNDIAEFSSKLVKEWNNETSFNYITYRYLVTKLDYFYTTINYNMINNEGNIRAILRKLLGY
jgi:hypothetical protein